MRRPTLRAHSTVTLARLHLITPCSKVKIRGHLSTDFDCSPVIKRLPFPGNFSVLGRERKGREREKKEKKERKERKREEKRKEKKKEKRRKKRKKREKEREGETKEEGKDD